MSGNQAEVVLEDSRDAAEAMDRLDDVDLFGWQVEVQFASPREVIHVHEIVCVVVWRWSRTCQSCFHAISFVFSV